MALYFSLKAENSSGKQDLHIGYCKESKEVNITLIGEYNGKPIQIDFKPLTEEEFQDLSDYVDLIKTKVLSE